MVAWRQAWISKEAESSPGRDKLEWARDGVTGPGRSIPLTLYAIPDARTQQWRVVVDNAVEQDLASVQSL